MRCRRDLICILLLLLASSLAASQLPNAKPSSRQSSASKNGDALPEFTSKQQAAALDFVRRHHPELADLLGQLQNGNPSEYQQALRDIFLKSEELDRTQQRDPERYELDLKAWRMTSQIRLLTAQLGMLQEELNMLEAKLRDVLEEQADVYLEIQILQRKRLADRLQAVDKQIARQRQRRTARVEKALRELKRAVRERAKATVIAKGSSDRKLKESGETKPSKVLQKERL